MLANFMRLTTVLVSALLCAPLLAAPELKGSPEELRSFLHPHQQTVSLQGQATVTAYTDIADVSLVVTTKDRDLAQSLKLNAELRATLRAAFIKAGISKDEIKSAKFSSSPQYGWFGKSPSSYEVVNRMQVSIRNPQHLQVIANASDQYAEVDFAGVDFRHSEKKASKADAQQQALDDVLAQKARYEKQLGLSLTPINFHYGVVRPVERKALRTRKIAYASESAGSLAPEPDLDSGFDEIKYQASAQVTFRVEAP